MTAIQDFKALNGLTVEQLYQVDYNNDRHSDEYLPWIFYLTFTQFDKYLRIEGDLDGNYHIKVELIPLDRLDKELEGNNLSDEPDLWQVYEPETSELLDELRGKTIQFCEYGIEKEVYDCSDIGEIGKNLFTFIRLNTDNGCYTISESLGLTISDDPNVKLHFEETFDRYDTKKESTNANHA